MAGFRVSIKVRGMGRVKFMVMWCQWGIIVLEHVLPSYCTKMYVPPISRTQIAMVPELTTGSAPRIRSTVASRTAMRSDLEQATASSPQSILSISMLKVSEEFVEHPSVTNVYEHEPVGNSKSGRLIAFEAEDQMGRWIRPQTLNYKMTPSEFICHDSCDLYAKHFASHCFVLWRERNPIQNP